MEVREQVRLSSKLKEIVLNLMVYVSLQMKQAADENCDIVSGKQVWKCESSKSITTVAEYASYQQKMLQKEREEGVNTGCVRDSGGEREFLSFGTNLDISDHTIWSQQLQELTKLPQFLRVRNTPSPTECLRRELCSVL